MGDQEPKFNVKAVIHETGLSAETLRAWERRYGLIKPQRTTGGHRLYTPREVEILKWLINRQKEGLSISRAVDLWRTLESNGEDPLLSEEKEVQEIPIDGTRFEELRQAWVESCLAFKERTAERIMAMAFAMFPPEVACTEVVQKGLAEIGDRWFENRSNTQQEHFATALAIRKLDTLIEAEPPPTRPERILAACPPGEEHTFGLLLLTYLVRRRGVGVIYLGANVSLSQLEGPLRATAPEMVIALAQTLPMAASLKEMGEYLEPSGIPLGFGGGIFINSPDLRRHIPGIYLGDNLSIAPAHIEKIMVIKPAPNKPDPLPPDYQTTLDEFFEVLPQLESAVLKATKSRGIQTEYTLLANHFFAQHLQAALFLGDIHLVENSLHWIHGLLEHYEPDVTLLNRYLAVYKQALVNSAQGRCQIIVDCLSKIIPQ